MRIDRRKNYYMMIDTETANSLDDPLVYDCGVAIVDKRGRVQEAHSFLVYEIFVQCADLMETAYYADKLPQYYDDLDDGAHRLVRWNTLRKIIKELADKYEIRAIVAHNGKFDYRAVQTTQRYITSSKYRFFLPYGVPMWCTMNMAEDTICKQKSYIRFCEKHGFMYGKRPRKTAEILYRYILDNPEYSEQHTGLEDVMIEKEIFARCMRQHKKMRVGAWEYRKKAA